MAAFGLGAVIGGAAALRFHPRRPLVALHVVMLGVAPGLILLAVHAPVGVIAVAEVLAGFAMGFGGTAGRRRCRRRSGRTRSRGCRHGTGWAQARCVRSG